MDKIFGIDLGTTNSLIAVFEGTQSQVLPNAEGNLLTPSVVGFTPDGECIVGELAKRQAFVLPARTIVSIKRKMGTDYKIRIDDHEYSPQEISAMILRKLKNDAELYLSDPVQKAIITVPAYFNDSERQATKDAGLLAGLEVVRIINEPTAAAIAYGTENLKTSRNILVFDLGGGTFDVSILAIDEGAYEVLATCGDMQLGGDDWDERIIQYLLEEFQKSAGIDLRKDPIALQRLKFVAEQAKWDLSETEKTKISLPFLAMSSTGPKHLDVELTRKKFEDLTKDLVQRLAIPAKQALEDAKITLCQIHQVILVGGATRMPMVQQIAKKLFMKAPVKDVDPEKTIALGAATQGAVLAGNLKDLVLLDVTSLSLGIETEGGAFSRIIPRNTTIPCAQKKIFTTVSDNQTMVEIKVYQGERAVTQHNKFLGSFKLKNIPPAPSGSPQIEVTFKIDSNGILSVEAKDLTTDTFQKLTIQSPTNLTNEEINRILSESKKYEEEDAVIRENRQTRNKAHVELELGKSFLMQLDKIVQKEKVTQVKQQMEKLTQALESQNSGDIQSQTLLLEKILFQLNSQLSSIAETTSVSEITSVKPAEKASQG